MSIEIIDILKPKNGLSFKLIEDIDISVSGYESLADAVAHFATKEGVISAINLALSGKQDKLSTTQLTAVNSGITSELVAQISLNTSAVNSKASQADLTALTATVNSKANAADLTALETEVDGKADASDLTTAQTSLQAQIDAIVTPVTQDAEVQNARVDSDGTSYTTLKARCDADDAKHTDAEQDLHTDISYIGILRNSKNLFNKNGVAVDQKVSAGSGNKMDETTADASMNCSNIIEVEAGQKYTGNSYFFGNNTARILMYTAAGYYIGGNDGVVNADGTITYEMVATTKYVRFNYNNSAIFNPNTYMFAKGATLPDFEPYDRKYIAGGYVKQLSDEVTENYDEVTERLDTIDASTPIAAVSDKIDHSKIVRYGYINGSTGEPVIDAELTNLWYSDYTEIIGGKQYYYGGYIAPIYCAFYDENQTYISGYNNDPQNQLPNPFTVPANAKYMRFTLLTSSATAYRRCWLNLTNEANTYTEDKYFTDGELLKENNVSNPCDYSGNSVMIFNKGVCIGDSITQGTFNYNEGGTAGYTTNTNYSYPTYFTKLSNVETVNKGIGGYTSVQWWDARKDDDFSGYDFAIINLGINDALQEVPAADTEEALENIITALRTANTGIKIFMATVVPAYSDYVTTFDAVNATIESVAEDNNCYLIDLSTYSHTRKDTISEAGHLTAYGYFTLAKDYIAAISHIIDNNKSDFKFVHFIGTDHSYT